MNESLDTKLSAEELQSLVEFFEILIEIDNKHKQKLEES